MLRWTIRILLLFVVLVLVAAGVVHLILKSDWLDERILARVGERIGMEVDAESLSVGWGGGTTVREVTVKMPLSGEVFFAADRIRLEHAIVPLLILRRPINLRSVRVDSPEVYLRQYESGRWNAQDVWTRLRATLRSADRRKRRTPLPEVAIRDARVRVAEPNGVSQTLGPLDFLARPEGLAWQFDLDAPAVAGVKGRVLPGGDWAHNVDFAVAGIEPLVRHILGGGLSPIRVSGQWEGRVVQSALSGILRLDRLAIGPVAARGNAFVQAKAGEITVRPQGLTFTEPNLAGQEVQVTGGSIRVGDGRIRVEQLAAASNLLTARIEGEWDWIAREGEFSGSWAGASDGRFPQYHGTGRASVKSPQSGRKAARVSVTAKAETSRGESAVTASAEGDGVDWRQSRWQISIPTFTWSRNDKQVDLAGAAAEIHLAWPEVRLTSLHLPGAKTTAADAQFDVDTRRWSARLAVENMGHLAPWGFESLDLLVNARGDDRVASVSELRIAQGARVVAAEGELSFRERGFQDVRLTADWPVGSPPPAQPHGEPPMGRWHLEGDVFGRIEPLAVEIAGQLTGQNIILGKRPLSQVQIPVRASADERWIRMTADPFDLLGGSWQLSGRHDLATEMTQVSLVVDNLSLEAAAEIAGMPHNDASHRGQGHAQVDVTMPRFDRKRATVTGSWNAEDIHIPPLEAQRARGKLRIANGLVQFDPIVLEQEGGQAQADVEFQLDDPQIVSLELQATKWPIHPLVAQMGTPGRNRSGGPGMREEKPAWSLYADGRARLRLNAVRRTVTGEANASGEVLWHERDLARIRISALMREQTLDLREIYAETLGGSMKGQATVPLNRWMDSRVNLGWQGIQPKLLQPWMPQFGRFDGVVSGSLAVERVDQAARPPEPMRFALDAAIENGRFGPAQVGNCRIIGFLGDQRLLIDEADFRFLDGRIKARSRVSPHAGMYYGSVAVDFNDLKLNQLVHVIDPNAAEHPGNLSGTAMVLASSSWDSFGGEARVSLTHSDLIGNAAVRTLYNTLNLRFGAQEPAGTGEARIRLEGPSVLIPGFSYFNRGVEIRGAWEIEDINRGRKSPVSGFAVASTRVLKGVRLPGVDALDRLLATFESGAASARIGGTLEQVEVKVVPLPEVLSSLRRLLWSQLQE